MHTNRYIAELRAGQMILICRKGFDSPQHWMNWRKKHAKEIESLPADLRNAVCMAWDNSGPREKLTSASESPKGPQE